MSKEIEEPWIELRNLLVAENPEDLEQFLKDLDPGDLVRTIFRLQESEQQTLLRTVSRETATEIIEDLPEAQAADLLDEMPAIDAAGIMAGMASDDMVDVLTEMENASAEAVLEAMDREEAADTRLLMSYDAEEAGGLMQTEYITYRQNQTVGEVLADMLLRKQEYAQYSAPYIYVVDNGNVLKGVLRIRDLVFADPNTSLRKLKVEAKVVDPHATLDELADYFDETEINVVPVVEPHSGTIIGIVRRRVVNEELAERSEAERLRQAGIVSGEEFRSLPVVTRSRRRFSWLSINIVLNVLAASVIAMYQDTLSAVIALAVFLPIVSDMSGCSGNQAVAVSLRELSLGIVLPKDVLRVWRQEAVVGLINGLALGLLIAAVAFLWQGNPWLGLVVGSALALNTIVAVSIGGTVPLLLRSLKVDPALASGPILTTVTDMCGFALVLGLATLALPLLV